MIVYYALFPVTVNLIVWLYDEFFVILHNILNIVEELDSCQIKILSIYVPSKYA